MKEYKAIKVYFTIRELMELTKLSWYRIRNYIKIKNIPYHKHTCTKGRAIRIHRNEVNKYFHIIDN
jgi:hypothetical protein